jgi:hypothetical protein
MLPRHGQSAASFSSEGTSLSGEANKTRVPEFVRFVALVR